MRLFRFVGVGLLFTMLAASCATRLPDLRTYKDPRDTPEYKALLASGASIDFFGCNNLNFKPGQPKPGQTLMSSLDSFSTKNFEQHFSCLGIISKTPDLSIEINGFADPAECTSDCRALSLRRAQAVRVALQQMHFPPGKIRCVAGHGASYLLDTSDSVANRRVEFWYEVKGLEAKECKV